MRSWLRSFEHEKEIARQDSHRSFARQNKRKRYMHVLASLRGFVHEQGTVSWDQHGVMRNVISDRNGSRTDAIFKRRDICTRKQAK